MLHDFLESVLGRRQLMLQDKARRQAAETGRSVYDGTSIWYPPGRDGIPICGAPSPDRIKQADTIK